MRVYRWVCPSLDNVTGSLTIREGISELSADERLFISFPHYTWGYITKKTTKARSSKVPSLYVRVYLSLHCTAHKRWSSLTIREGISVCLLFLVPCPVFPHYTWGYIIRSRYDAGLFQVPSLYVRVYRQELFSRLYAYCSLTIREGISPILMADYILRMFPHYTWGYIARR